MACSSVASYNDKLEKANQVLWAFRKKAIDNMVTSMSIKYTYPNHHKEDAQGLDQEQRHILKTKKCLFRSGDGFRVKWDLLIMFLAVYS